MIQNRRGQTLVMFVILIPLFIGLVAFLIDMGYIVSAKVHARGVIETVLKSAHEQNSDAEEIKKMLIKNNINVDELVVEFQDNKIYIKNVEVIDSIFGAIIGIDNYKIKIEAVLENNKVYWVEGETHE